MTVTIEDVQADWIASLKSKTAITSLLIGGGAGEIREAEWQGDKFTYPNIRVSVDIMPSTRDCGPMDAEILLEVFSEEKSSKQGAHIASVIHPLYHARPFTINGHRYNVVDITKIERPNRSMYAWVTKIYIDVQVV